MKVHLATYTFASCLSVYACLYMCMLAFLHIPTIVLISLLLNHCLLLVMGSLPHTSMPCFLLGNEGFDRIEQVGVNFHGRPYATPLGKPQDKSFRGLIVIVCLLGSEQIWTLWSKSLSTINDASWHLGV